MHLEIKADILDQFLILQCATAVIFNLAIIYACDTSIIFYNDIIFACATATIFYTAITDIYNVLPTKKMVVYGNSDLVGIRPHYKGDSVVINKKNTLVWRSQTQRRVASKGAHCRIVMGKGPGPDYAAVQVEVQLILWYPSAVSQDRLWSRTTRSCQGVGVIASVTKKSYKTFPFKFFFSSVYLDFFTF